VELERLMQAKGLTINDLAERLGCVKSTVYHWITGRYSPDVRNVQKICRILDITPNELLGFQEAPYARPVFSRLRRLQKAVTKHGDYNSQQLDQIANAMRGKSQSLECYFRDVAQAVYNLELTISHKKETTKSSQQLSLLPPR